MKSNPVTARLPLLFLPISLCLLCVYGAAQSTSAATPFSPISWEDDSSDVIALSNNHYDTYDSVYGGLCYTYPQKYQGKDGMIKYMFDDRNRLMSVAWTYSAPSQEELFALYDQLHAEIEAVYGTSGYNSDTGTSAGDVWYLEDGDIIISIMNTASIKALQYSYLHPEVSNHQH